MAKKSMIQKEIKRQKLVNKYTDKRKKIKKTIKETTNDFEKQIKFQQELQKLPRDSSPCKLRNRCWVTGRSRGVYRDFGLSRHVFREMAHECLLPGVTKSSW